MIFIETSFFTEDVLRLLDDESYASLQRHLAAHPEAGDLIQETGGLRKVRWLAGGRGKRGGVRVIYYFAYARQQIRMLLIYRKGRQDDLTPAQKAVLRRINEVWE